MNQSTHHSRFWKKKHKKWREKGHEIDNNHVKNSDDESYDDLDFENRNGNHYSHNNITFENNEHMGL